MTTFYESDTNECLGMSNGIKCQSLVELSKVEKTHKSMLKSIRESATEFSGDTKE